MQGTSASSAFINGVITKHITDLDHITTLRQMHFQDGQAAFHYLPIACQLAMTQSRLRELDRQWTDLDLITDVGVSENTVLDLLKKIKVMNSKRGHWVRARPMIRWPSGSSNF